jgi:LDH2 family malate/lactate/ureidoglycolate dehydrogenase
LLTKAGGTRRVSAGILRAFLVDALRACGLCEVGAATAAGAMVEADLAGADAHGIFRLAGYVREIKRGAINVKARVSVIEPLPSRGELNVGQFVVALDVARFMPPDLFKAEIDCHVRNLASSRPLSGVEAVRVPGQGRLARSTERERNGVPLDAALLVQVDNLAQSLGVLPLGARI